MAVNKIHLPPRSQTFEVHNGRPGLTVLGDLSQNAKGANSAPNVLRFQQVDKQVQASAVLDS